MGIPFYCWMESDRGLRHCSDGKWHTESEINLSKDNVSTSKKCHSLRAFRRNLKHVAKLQPELIGESFTLVSNWVDFKGGKRISLDVTMRVR